MSSVQKIQDTDDKLDLLLRKFTALENAVNELRENKKESSSGKKRVVTFTRGEKKVPSIHILPFESKDQKIKICLIGSTTDPDTAYVISVEVDEFRKLAEKVSETDIGKVFKIYNYKGDDCPAMLIDNEWQLVDL